jgi:hypothetical protein
MRRSVLLLLAVPLFAVACGGSKHRAQSAASPLDAVKAAFRRTISAGSESLAMKASTQASGQAVTLSGKGAFDTNTRNGALTLRIDAGPISTSVDEILVGNVVYARSPLLAGQLPPGKSWIKVQLAQVGSLAGVGQSFFSQNPADELKRLQFVKSATRVGSERIGTRYRAVLDTARFPAAARAASTYDVWVGDDGYVRRVQVAAAKPQAVTVTVDLSDFGSKVSASPPPADQVYTAAKGKLSGLGG